MAKDRLDSLKFEVSKDGVKPEDVPKVKLYNGALIPAIGLGTFGSDHVPHDVVAETVLKAAEVGYRHFDCAAVYGNEKHIGKMLRKIIEGGVKREELWITSKVWNDKHTQVIEACQQTLNDLQLDYLDLYLVHWPFRNFHPPGCGPDYRSPDAHGYIHEEYMETWRQMEELLDMGLVKNIGTSNMTIPKMELLLRDAEVKPVVNEMELHPYFQQKDFVNYLKEHQIVPIAYSPLGSPGRSERDRMSDDLAPMDDPVINKIAKDHNTTAAAICIKWAVQRGQVPIPFSVHHYLENIKAVFLDDLSEEEMQQIESIDKNNRLIKGVVFLWKDNQDWRDLWDVDGTIPK
ncbi:MAG: aldo/keto reductase [Promethearchaeota archaeon]